MFKEIRRWKEADNPENFVTSVVANSTPVATIAGTDWSNLSTAQLQQQIQQQQIQQQQSQSFQDSNGTATAGWGDSTNSSVGSGIAQPVSKLNSIENGGNDRWGAATNNTPTWTQTTGLADGKLNDGLTENPINTEMVSSIFLII